MTDETNRWARPDDSVPAGPGTWLPAYPAPQQRGRGPAFVGIAVASVLVLAAGAFAVSSLVSGGTPGSPEEAVEAMFAAIADEDVLGVLDALAPAERELYQPFIEDVVDELQRLEVLSGDLDLGAIGGIELDVSDLKLTSAPLGGSDRLELVTVLAGTITSTVDPDGVPLGSFVRDLMEEQGAELEPVTATESLAADDAFDLVVVDDGGWHVSLHYSIAEAARQAAGAPLPDFSASVVPDGAETPERAIEELLQAAVDLDLRTVIALLPPGEMSALHDYAPLFLGEADEAIEELRDSPSFDISIDRLDTSATRDGSTANVTISGFAVSGSIDDESFDASFDGDCFSGSFDGESEELCLDDLEEEGLALGIGRSAFAQELVDAQLGVVTVQRDGLWYVSPTRSFQEVVLALMRVVDREDLEDPEQLLSNAFGFSPFLYGGGFGGFGEDTFSMEEDFGFEEDFGVADEYDDPFAECNAFLDDLPFDATEEEYDAASKAFNDCFDELAGSDAGAAIPGAECDAVYEDLPAGATEEELAAADEAWSACDDAATGG